MIDSDDPNKFIVTVLQIVNRPFAIVGHVTCFSRTH